MACTCDNPACESRQADLGFIEVDDVVDDVVYEDEVFEPVDPYLGLPFGEQQREVDYLETRYESEPEPYDGLDDWDW